MIFLLQNVTAGAIKCVPNLIIFIVRYPQPYYFYREVPLPVLFLLWGTPILFLLWGTFNIFIMRYPNLDILILRYLHPYFYCGVPPTLLFLFWGTPSLIFITEGFMEFSTAKKKTAFFSLRSLTISLPRAHVLVVLYARSRERMVYF